MSTNLTIYRGRDVSLDIAVTLDSDPYDLTSCSLWFTAKEAYTDDDVDAVFQKEIGSGITVTSAASGLATIAIEPSDTSGLSAVKTVLFWDIKLETDAGKFYTLNEGKLIINPDVTISES
jgi:hypothetical protein